MTSTLINPYPPHIIRVMRSYTTKAQLKNARSWALNIISNDINADELSFEDFYSLKKRFLNIST